MYFIGRPAEHRRNPYAVLKWSVSTWNAPIRYDNDDSRAQQSFCCKWRQTHTQAFDCRKFVMFSKHEIHLEYGAERINFLHQSKDTVSLYLFDAFRCVLIQIYKSLTQCTQHISKCNIKLSLINMTTEYMFRLKLAIIK